MSRPFDRSCSLDAAGPLDDAAGEFWVGNPWKIVADKRNLSAYERNAVYLNLGGERFANVGFASAADSDGDGRSVIAADLDGDGMQDLVVRQAGGGALLVFRNQLPARHSLRVSLRGTKSNGLGVGARLVAEVGSKRLVREQYPMNSYTSQHPNQVHFGLADHARVDRLTIQWPSGHVDALSNIPADRHVRITEGAGSWIDVGK